LSTVSGAIPNDSWVDYDVTAAITGDGTYSFAISSTTTNSLFFNSSEAPDNLPVLIIETDGSANLLLNESSPERGVVRQLSLNSVPTFAGTGQCLDGTLQFTITNQGDPMTEAAGYSLFGPSGELEPGTFGPLDIDGTATITVPSITEGGTYTLFVGLDGLVITAECAVPTATPTFTATATETPVPTVEPTLTPTATETPTPLPTFTWIPAPTLAPTATEVPPTATLAPTATPLPLGLPFSDNLDSGPAAWSVSGGWTLQDAAQIGGVGAFWYANSNTAAVETLSLAYPLDLRTALHPILRFDSVLAASHSIANVEISLDGVVWQPVFGVLPSGNWQTVYVDLSAYQQQTVWLRWVRLVQDPQIDQPADFWMVDNVAVADASVLLPSPTPTSTYTLVPTAAPTETPLPTNTVEAGAGAVPAEATPEVTEAPSP
jgi:hypothetical protein